MTMPLYSWSDDIPHRSDAETRSFKAMGPTNGQEPRTVGLRHAAIPPLSRFGRIAQKGKSPAMADPKTTARSMASWRRALGIITCRETSAPHCRSYSAM